MNLPDCCPLSSSRVYRTSTSPKTLKTHINHVIGQLILIVSWPDGPRVQRPTPSSVITGSSFVFSRSPAFTVVVDGGVNDSALIESKAVALGAQRLPPGCGAPRGKDNCFVSKSAQSGVRAPRAGEHRQTSQGSCTPPPLTGCHVFLILPITFFPPHIPASWPCDRHACFHLEPGIIKADEMRFKLCLLLESLIPNWSGPCARAAGHKQGRRGGRRPPRLPDLERMYDRQTGDTNLPAC